METDETHQLSSDDLRLIHAMQIAPRASWADLASVIDCDPVTAARRWQRLRDDGYAWVTAYRLGPRTIVALIELSCSPGCTLQVAEILAGDREAATIDVTVGGRDLVLTAGFESEDQFGDYLLTRLGRVDGVTNTRTHVLGKIVSDARTWRLRVLTAPEIAAAEAVRRPPGRRTLVGIDADTSDRVLAALSENGRINATELAALLECGVDRARAALNSVLADSDVVVRTEVARRYSGRPTYGWFFLRVPARSMETALRRLVTLKDIRLLATSIGTCNLVMAMWLPGLDDIQRIEAVIEQAIPEIQVMDRSLVLRTPRHLRRRLTPTGRSSI